MKNYVGEPTSEQIALALSDSGTGDATTSFRTLRELIRVSKGIIHPIVVNHTASDEMIVIEGNVIQIADRVMEALQAKYFVSPVRFEGMQRYETLEIPKEAMREILYNAIAHKDYTGPDIQMHVYNDHIEVWNEGELPAGYTPETLLGQHSSRPRNKNIANAFFKAGFIDAWGRGYKKIREGFESVGLPMPKVENFCGGVQVTFQRKNVANNSGQTEKKS